MRKIFTSLLMLSAGLVTCRAEPQADWVYLTWQDDPSTTMTVSYVTEGKQSSRVEYAVADPTGPAADRRLAVGRPLPLPGSDDLWVHHVKLEELEPGTAYSFFVAADGEGASPRRFRTLTAGDEPLRFAVGGDMGTSQLARRMAEVTAGQKPQALLIGGDIAYGNGLPRRLPHWLDWLQIAHETLQTPDGFTIPLILAIGNHEVNRGRRGGVGEEAPATEAAPFFFALFPQSGERTFFRRQLGGNAALYVLDSGHLTDHRDQASWLAEQLERDRELPYRFALYHVPLYPSHRTFDEELSVAGRTHWEPLFSRLRLTSAFEHHEHTFKRSKPIRDGRPVIPGEGVLYLGDGGLGRKPRRVGAEKPWYIERSASLPHVWIVDATPEGVHFRAVGEGGEVLDRVTLDRVTLDRVTPDRVTPVQ